MKYISKVLLKIAVLNIIFLFVMSGFRTAFFLYYGKGIDFTGLGADIFRAFVMGLRLDACVLALLNIPVVIAFTVFLILSKREYFKKFFSGLKIYYTAAAGLLFVFLACDFGFYSYFQNHFNSMIYGLFEDDTKAILLTMWHNYNVPLLILGFAAVFVAVYFISKAVLKTEVSKKQLKIKIWAKIALPVVLAFLTLIVARGTFAEHPLIVNYAVSSNVFLNKTAINGVFTFQDAVASKTSENNEPDYIALAGYSNNIRQAFADYLETDIKNIPQTNPESSLNVKYGVNDKIEKIKPNVIIIVMESFGSDLLQYNSPEFNVLGELKKHFDSDLVFYNYVPAWHSTQESVEGIITNVAIRPLGLSRFQSKYQYVHYDSDGHKPYKQKGYQTVFLYGGNTGWRNIGNYMANSSFDKVIGAAGMDASYSSNEWGVYDEYLFDKLYKILDNGQNQKFIYALTTTNHPPYSLPDNYTLVNLNIPKELDERIIGRDLALKRFQSYRYANEMLGRFLTKFKNSKYAQNTIIAVVGDHNFKNIYSYLDKDFFNQVRVPFYLYAPEQLKPKNADVNVFASYLDILPTLYSLSLSNVNVKVMGKNIFSKDAENNIIYSPGNNFLADKNYIVRYFFANNGALGCFIWSDKTRGEVEFSAQRSGHKRLVKYANAQIAVADYIIKHTGEK
ncbi:LTA synthase family protein [Endomicrobium proavitum]|uniref:Sulfatase N-terminal domain-containing protein n=1 Tax=Endomicrobium proavitum TaxID=1408281 RepID=A0A0G3WIQ1_9BACT|nr:alkaline phosphatase family protein [Endomicrobium proavitum]AKL97757.1 hypothetical protein Epro_0378 [Endomicrobium proavitum]